MLHSKQNLSIVRCYMDSVESHFMFVLLFSCGLSVNSKLYRLRKLQLHNQRQFITFSLVAVKSFITSRGLYSWEKNGMINNKLILSYLFLYLLLAGRYTMAKTNKIRKIFNYCNFTISYYIDDNIILYHIWRWPIDEWEFS